MLILVQEKNKLVRVNIFHDTYFESSQIHELTAMYYFEHINHKNPLNF